jgi:hypothetical protein
VHGAMKSVRLAAEEGRPPLFHFHPDPPAQPRDPAGPPFHIPSPISTTRKNPPARPSAAAQISPHAQTPRCTDEAPDHEPRVTGHGRQSFQIRSPVPSVPVRAYLAFTVVPSGGHFYLQTSNVQLDTRASQRHTGFGTTCGAAAANARPGRARAGQV